MKNFVSICAVAFLTLQIRANAQNLSADSVIKLLCKKWAIDYAITAGKKADMPAGKALPYFEFYKDGTFFLGGGESKVNIKGKWEYNVKTGKLTVTFEGKGSKDIMSLTKNQFVMYADAPMQAPDSVKTKVYFKVKQE